MDASSISQSSKDLTKLFSLFGQPYPKKEDEIASTSTYVAPKFEYKPSSFCMMIDNMIGEKKDRSWRTDSGLSTYVMFIK